MDYQQQEYMMQFLMGLNEAYGSIRGQILMLDPLPPIAKVFNLLVQEERQRIISSSSLPQSMESMAFNISSSPSQPLTAVSYYRPKQQRDRPICSHCGISGHTMDRCFKLHGFPPGYKPKPKPHTQPQPPSSLQSNASGPHHS